MLGCVVQNFYSENPYLSKTFRYNSLLNYKKSPYINLFLKHLILFYSSPISHPKSIIILNIYKDNVVKNFYNIFTLFTNKLGGT